MTNYVPMTAPDSLARAQAAIKRIFSMDDERVSLVHQIAVEIGAEIMEDVLLPGHDLNSVDLSRRYQTSRTPIREALMLLEKEGLIEISPRRRPRVIVLDIATIREIYRTRAALLEFVARDVAVIASEDELHQLAAKAELMRAASAHDDINTYLWANIDFHNLNLKLSRNVTAKRIVESLLLRTVRLRRRSLSAPGRMSTSLDDHLQLVRAYFQRDPNLAAALISSNHATALRNIESRL